MKRELLAFILGLSVATAMSVAAMSDLFPAPSDISRAKVLRDEAKAATLDDAEQQEMLGLLGDMVLGQ